MSLLPRRNAEIKATGALAVLFLLLVVGRVSAEPYLQLDAAPAVYLGPPEESVFAPEPEFTLYALINSEYSQFSLTETFYLSAALVPKTEQTVPAPDLGSFVFAGQVYAVAGDMEYGTPPISVDLKSEDLAGHGIFETYYKEFSFALDPDKTAPVYNSQDNPGGPDLDNHGDLYYRDFAVDVSGLASGYALHFDLYTVETITKGGKDVPVVADFAPFSHDLLTVPAPGALMLAVTGLGTAGSLLRRKRQPGP